MSEKMNLNASGATHLQGGEYGDARVSGALKVSGDISCDSLRCSGSTKIDGALVCVGAVECSGSVKVAGDASIGYLRHSGSFACEGNVVCTNEIESSGSTKIDGDLTMGNGGFSGSCIVGGALHAGVLRCSGKVQVSKGLEAEAFTASGVTEIGGLLNAEKIEISLGGKCEVADIGCSTLLVKKNHSFSFSKFTLRANSIEGDDVELLATKAEVVRGKNVRIGKGCEIGRVEYSENLEIDGGTVGEQVRV